MRQGPGASERIRAGWVSLVAGTVICAGKFTLAELTLSTALFSDALESVVNVVAAGLLLFSMKVAARPPDADHPYGHGKVEFFSAGVEGALIAVAAVLILVEAVRELIAGPQIERLDLGILAGIGLAGANALVGVYLVHTGRRTHSLALEADGRHVLTDVFTTVGVVAGLVLVRLTGIVALDPLMAILVALSILRTGARLLRDAVGGLMDEADEPLLAGICDALEDAREPGWIDVHGLRVFRSGATHHVDFHLAVPRYFDADRLHEMNDRLEGLVDGAIPGASELIVHFDPCRPRQCGVCAMEACPVRAAPYSAREPFALADARRVDEALESGHPLPGGSVPDP